MLSSIHPLGERAKRQRYSVTVVAHILGATFGGLALGALIGLVAMSCTGAIAPTVRALVVASIAAVAAAAEFRGGRTPSWRRQVNEDWLTTYRGWVYGGGYGLQLGFAFVTIITSASTWVMAGAALMSGSFVASVVICTTFGLVRGLTVLSTRSVTTTDALRAHARRLHDRAPTARRGVEVVLTASVVILVTATIRSLA